MKKKVSIEIDEKSGFCFGVVNAIRKAENALKEGKELYCLGDIVHNSMEVKRLEDLGLKTINHEAFALSHNKTVLLRAHGEPPRTYVRSEVNNITLIDATCPVVLRLQRNVRKAYEQSLKDNGQVVIYGKLGHAEVNGLVGQTDGSAIVIQSSEDIDLIDIEQPVYLFSQTTMMVDKYNVLQSEIQKRISNNAILNINNTICRQVSGRINDLQKFSIKKDVIIFVSGKKSSNGKALFSECRKANKQSHMVADENEVNFDWFNDAQHIGICGATSTPDWLMKKVADFIEVKLQKQNQQ